MDVEPTEYGENEPLVEVEAEEEGDKVDLRGVNEERKSLADDLKKMGDLAFFHDVPLQVSAELGRLTLKMRDLLSLGQGSVMELDKLAGEPLEILINQNIICRGEVIVINEKYGVRMTDIVSPGNDQTKNKNLSRGTGS